MQTPEPESKKSIIKMVVAGVIFLVAVGVAWKNLAGDSQAEYASIRGFMCNDCKAVFDYTPKEGDREPIECPKCGHQSGYSAERCYWTKGPDGEWAAKAEPTYVILNIRLDRNNLEPTFCPDCGREVIGHNPLPPEELMTAALGQASQ